MTMFGRQYAVQIDTIRTTDLDVDFRVTKTLEPQPNTASLVIYNLTPDHRHALHMQAPYGIYVDIEAGYRDGMGRIFRGYLRDASSYRDGTDWVTEVHSGDGEDRFARARVNRSYAAGTQVDKILTDVLRDMGIGMGNAIRSIQSGKLAEAGRQFLNGCTVSGQASKQLDRLMKSIGKEWSIQDGEFQVIDKGTCLPGPTIRIDKDTGLIGSPTVSNDGLLSFRALMNHEIVPGRMVQVKSREVSEAYYRVERCDYTGATRKTDWYVDVEASLYVPALFTF